MCDRLLIVEFTTACGTPSTIATEGIAMTRALMHDARRGRFEVHAVVSESIERRVTEGNASVTTHPVRAGENYLDMVDMVAPYMSHAFAVAPEFHGHLLSLSKLLERRGCTLLSQPSRAVELASHKYRSLERLSSLGIDTPKTQYFKAYLEDPAFPYPAVVKPVHGAGCMGVHVVNSATELATAARAASNVSGSTGEVIVQEFIDGEPLSSSAIAHAGGCELLGLNTQDIRLVPAGTGDSTYAGGIAGISRPGASRRCHEIAMATREAFELDGYFGVDLVLDGNNIPFVVEVNPRLTTPFIAHVHLVTRSLLRSMVNDAWDEPLIKPDTVCGYSIRPDRVPTITTGKNEEEVRLATGSAIRG